MTLDDIIAVVTIQDSLTFVLLYLVENGIRTLAVNNGCIDVDDHIAVHMTCVIATAIDVTTLKATVQVIIVTRACRCSREVEIVIRTR